jgi:hypothetical protein
MRQANHFRICVISLDKTIISNLNGGQGDKEKVLEQYVRYCERMHDAGNEEIRQIWKDC